MRVKYKKTVLVIDDMKQIRDILWFSLKKEGYRAILAENGPAGLNILFNKTDEIDLVILDVMMPKMDGYTVLEKIRTSNALVSNVPVIMLTAKAQKEDVVRGVQKGADAYIVKPYKFPDLLARIKSLIA